MKRILLSLFGALAALSALSFQLSTALAQLTTFTNPTPVASEHFGHSVAALGTDRVVIGADMEYTGAIYAGAA